jgi:hydrogenase maturation protease
MKSALEQIVNVDLDNDFVEHPDRTSSKMPQCDRFGSGRVYPQVFSERQNGADPCVMQAECLFRARAESPRLRITLAFLQPVPRKNGAGEKVLERLPENGRFRVQDVPQLEAGGKTFQAWLEAVERKVLIFVNGLRAPARTYFAFPASESRETIQNESGGIAGLIFRRHQVLEGKIEIKITRLQDDLFRISARVVNLSSLQTDETESPEKVLLRTFASTHFKLEAEGGEFVSFLETGDDLRNFAGDCQNIGCWPVLVGDRLTGDRKSVLAFPIVPNDYPQIAGALESPDTKKWQLMVEKFLHQILERTSALNTKDIFRLYSAFSEILARDLIQVANEGKLLAGCS